MSDRLSVQIVATDNASPKFVTVANAADKMGASVAKAGQTGARGLDALQKEGRETVTVLDSVERNARETTVAIDRMATSSTRTSQAIDRGKQSHIAYGAAITTVLGTLSSFAQAAAEEDVIFRRLEGAVEATGAQYDDYADKIDAAVAAGQELSFSDDSVADALARLTTQTGSVDVALEQMSLAMDVARARGLTLVQAAELIGRVHEGNIGILSRYGIVVKEGATAQETLALLQERTAGQAESYAESVSGSADRIKNSFDNATETIGAHTAGLQTALVILPGLSAGYTLVGGVLGKLAASTKAASLATTALSVATNPYVLAAGAAVAVGGLLIKAHHDDEVATRNYEVAIRSATTALFDLKELQGVSPALEAAAATAASLQLEVQAGIDAREQYYENIDLQQDALDLLEQRMLSTQEAADIEADYATIIGTSGEALGENVAIVQTWLDAYHAGTLLAADFIQNMDDMAANAPHWGESLLGTADDVAKLSDNLTEVIDKLATNLSKGDLFTAGELIETQWKGITEAAIAGGEATAGQLELVDQALAAIFSNTGPGAQQVRDNIAAVFDTFERSPKTAADLQILISSILVYAGALSAHDRAAARATVIENTLREAFIATGGAMKDLTRATLEHQAILAVTQESLTQPLDEYKAAQEAAAQAALDRGAAAVASYREESAAVKENEDRLVGYIDALGQLPTMLDVSSSASADFINNLTAGLQQLDTAISVVIDGTEAIGQSSGKLDKWATELIGPTDTLAEIDELLKSGAISQDEYNRAQAAQVEIARNNAAIQEDLLAIQVQQAPFLAEQQRNQVIQIDQLRHMSTEQQQVALGWMDVAEAQRAQDAVNLAATAHGEQAQRVVTETLQQVTDADPILKAMLEDIGLITTDQEGNITVNFDGATELTDTVLALRDSIELLTDAILGVPAGTTTRIRIEGMEDVNAAKQALTDLYTLANTPIAPIDFDRFIRGPESLPLPDTPPGGQPTTVQPAVPRVVPTPVRPIPRPAATATVRPLAAPELAVDQTLTITLELDPAPAEATAKQTIGDINDMTGTVTIDGTNDQAIESVTLAVAAANRARGTVSIAGNRSSFDSTMAGINGRILATAYVQVVGIGSGIGLTNANLMLGGVVPHAMHGMVGDGRNVLVGEAGPEMVRLPGGSYVTPSPATMGKLRGGGGGASGAPAINNYGSINIYPPSAEVYDSIVAAMRTQGR